MRIVLDPGPGGRMGPPDEAAANLRVAMAAASALRLATSDEVEVAVTRRGPGASGYEAGRDATKAADLAIRIEHGPFEVVVSVSASAGAKDLAPRLASAMRRDVGQACRLRFDGHRRLLKGAPRLIVASLPVEADYRNAGRVIAGTLAAHVAAAAIG